MLPKAERQAIRERCKHVTRGPWQVRVPNGRPSVWTLTPCKVASVESPDYPNGAPVQNIGREYNARFIAHARDDIPALLDALDEMEQALQASVELNQIREEQLQGELKRVAEMEQALRDIYEHERHERKAWNRLAPSEAEKIARAALGEEA